MLRALVWKEWRQQRSVVLAGLALAAALPPFVLAGMSFLGGRVDVQGLAQMLPVVYGALLWPLFAAAAGAGIIAGEVGEGTLGFLLSRPLSRAWIWTVKTGTALGSFLLVMAGSLLLAEVMRRLSGAGGGPDGTDAATLLLAPANAFLFFAASTFLSSLVSRPMTAAAGGVAVALGIVTLVGAAWARIDVVPRIEPGWMALELLLAGAAILPASLYVFARGEMLRGRGALRAAALAAAVAILAAGLTSAPILARALRLDPAGASLWNLSLSPSRDALVGTASRADGGAPEVWWIPTDGSGLMRLTGRLAYGGVFTPGGDIVYLSQHGLLGLRSTGSTELWRITPGRFGGERIASGLPDYLGALAHARYNEADPMVSPDGRRFAVGFGADLFVTDGSGVVSPVRLAGTPLEDCELLGWSPEGRELILFRSRWGDASHSLLGAYDVDTGRSRVIFESEERILYPYLNLWHGSVLTGEGGALLRVYDGKGIVLLDVRLADGERRELVRSTCLSPMDRPAGGQLLAYARCEGELPDDRRSEIRVRDLVSGEESALATLPGTVGQLRLSPGGDRVAVGFVDPGKNRALVVGPDGTGVEFEEAWSVLGWSGRDGVVLVRGWETPTRIAIGSVDGTIQRTIFPPG